MKIDAIWLLLAWYLGILTAYGIHAMSRRWAKEITDKIFREAESEVGDE
jgi:hypothetical protein